MRIVFIPLVVVLAASCASSSQATGGSRTAGGKCGLASLYVQRHIDAAMVPVQGNVEENGWGEDVVGESLGDATKRLETAMGCRFVPVGEIVGKGAYRDVPELSDASKWSTVQGMKPIRTDGSAASALAKLADDAGVDAVVVVRAAFALQMSAEDMGSNRQFGAADFVAIAVAPDGKRVLDSAQIVESPTYSFTLGDVPTELQASALEKEAKRLSKIALSKGIDGLKK
jgi:hypothetical protein